MKFLSTLVTQGTGVVGNLVMERNGVIRNRNSPANPSTTRQDQVRARLGTFAQLWSGSLTDIQRAAWKTFAATLTRKNAIGQTKKTSGIAAYVGANCALQLAGQNVVDTPPAGSGDLSMPPLLTLVVDDSSNTVIATFDGTIDTDQWLSLFLSPDAVSLGRMVYSGPYHYQATVEGQGSASVTFTAPAAMVAGQKWGYRLALVTTDGQVAPDVEGITTVQA